MMIAEVSEKYDLTQDTLRYYERIGLIPPVGRNQSRIRDYSEDDCRRIEFVKCMRSAGLPIEALIEYFGLIRQGDSTVVARKELLTEQRELLTAKMKAMQESLDRLNYKIEWYEYTVALKEKELAKDKK